MKKINMLLFFSIMIVTGGFLSSCQKDEVVNQDIKVSSELKVVDVNCEECVPTWMDTQITYDKTFFIPQSNAVPLVDGLYLDVYNDETTIYYRVYNYVEPIDSVKIGDGPYIVFNPPVNEYSWSSALAPDWQACDLVSLDLIVGFFHKSGHVNLSIDHPLRDVCEEVECSEETAWAFGPRYTLRGNWATYTPYVANSTVNIYAGQTMLVGTAHFSAIVNGEVTITINLINGSHFQNVEESLKIQGYNSPPAGNPAPGQFTYKDDATGTSHQIVVAAYPYYGIHLDVMACE